MKFEMIGWFGPAHFLEDRLKNGPNDRHGFQRIQHVCNVWQSHIITGPTPPYQFAYQKWANPTHGFKDRPIATAWHLGSGIERLWRDRWRHAWCHTWWRRASRMHGDVARQIIKHLPHITVGCRRESGTQPHDQLPSIGKNLKQL